MLRIIKSIPVNVNYTIGKGYSLKLLQLPKTELSMGLIPFGIGVEINKIGIIIFLTLICNC